MTLYIVESRAGLDYEGDQYEILGIFDTIEKAEACKDRYLNSESYERENRDFDYVDVDINEYIMNEDARDF